MGASDRSELPRGYSTWQSKGGGWYSGATDTDASLFDDEAKAIAECWDHYNAHPGYVAAIAALREAVEFVEFAHNTALPSPLKNNAGDWLDQTEALRKETTNGS